jgi:phosphate-selective porin OprO and OprP
MIVSTRRLVWLLGAVVVLGAAASSEAADLFYVESEQDGRLYVFADRAAHERWTKTGAIATPLTLAAYGPKGEDVVFDGEAAANLYNARHGRTGAGPAPAAGPSRFYWKNGETVAEFDNARITLQNRVQFRFTEELPNDKLQLPGTSRPGEGKPSFKIRRAKTQLAGWAFWPELTFELQVGWAGSDSGAGAGTTFSGLEDAYLAWDMAHKGSLQVQGGQFKVPFGRQELTSSERQQFVDRSVLSGEFTHGRDVGVMVGGGVSKGKLDWRVGAFNGNGRNKPTNDNTKLQWNARVTFQPFGDVGYSEGDFESKDHPLLAVAGEFESNDLSDVTNANDFNNTIYGGDVVFKYKGFSAFAEYFDRRRQPEVGPSFHSNGYHLQAGYFVVRDRFEVAFRWAAWDPTDELADNDRTELGGALSYYLRKHRLKIQGDFRRLEDQGRAETDHELRVQTQFTF